MLLCKNLTAVLALFAVIFSQGVFAAADLSPPAPVRISLDELKAKLLKHRNRIESLYVEYKREERSLADSEHKRFALVDGLLIHAARSQTWRIWGNTCPLNGRFCRWSGSVILPFQHWFR